MGAWASASAARLFIVRRESINNQRSLRNYFVATLGRSMFLRSRLTPSTLDYYLVSWCGIGFSHIILQVSAGDLRLPLDGLAELKCCGDSLFVAFQRQHYCTF